MAAKTWARVRPTTCGTALGPRLTPIEVLRCTVACHATDVPGAGDCATTVFQVPFARPGPEVTK